MRPFLLKALLVTAFASFAALAPLTSAAAAPVASLGDGSLSSSYLSGFTQLATTHVSESHIQPGEPVTVSINQDERRTYDTPTPDCSPHVIQNDVQPLTLFSLDRVTTLGGTYWNQGVEGLTVPATNGTLATFQEDLCASWHMTRKTDFTIAAEDTANLLPGCYQVVVWDEDLLPADTTQGTIASFTVGDGNCGATLKLSGTSAMHATLVKAGVIGAGVDRAHLEGVPETTLQGTKLCVRSFWTASIKLAAPASVPLEWEGQPRPFPQDSEFQIIATSPPQTIKGVSELFKGKYFETVSRTRCAANASDVAVSAPATIAGIGMFQSLTHRAEMWVENGSTGAILGKVTVPEDSSNKKGLLNVDRQTDVLTIPVD